MKSKVHPTYKTKYRVANWPAYNQALVRRGDVTGRCCMNTLWGWGRASWAGCGPDVRRGGHPEIDADHGIFGDKSPLIGHLAGPIRRLKPLGAQRQEKCGPNHLTREGLHATTPRDAGSAFTFARDRKARLANRVQLTSDGFRLYVDAVEDVFGADVDYAQLVKLYGASGENETRYSPAQCIGCLSKTVTGNPDPKHVSTSYVERANLTMRMRMRRVTRLTNGFSKKVEHHIPMVARYAVFYNFTTIHKTLRVTPAMQAGLTDHAWNMEEIVRLLEEVEAPVPAAQSN